MRNAPDTGGRALVGTVRIPGKHNNQFRYRRKNSRGEIGITSWGTAPVDILISLAYMEVR